MRNYDAPWAAALGCRRNCGLGARGAYAGCGYVYCPRHHDAEFVGYEIRIGHAACSPGAAALSADPERYAYALARAEAWGLNDQQAELHARNRLDFGDVPHQLWRTLLDDAASFPRYDVVLIDEA